ncbi:uncharacterized protein LOC143919727 isoform X2 [Arctopsyche grandis]|uniref:uncharacterized protein LOC143919727 isoform X2 n=1 Tax=Arctopsyche grandis TaxID=121162 RepID=UPI00406D6D3D
MTCTLHISIVHELSLMWKLYLGSLAFTRVFVLVHHIPAIANSVLERFFTQFPAPGLTERTSNNERLRRWRKREPLILDAGALGDLPAVYKIAPVLPHQFPVIGVYIDPRVHTGFRYKVKPLNDLNSPDGSKKLNYLFAGRALTLLSIGRGYAKRLTFESGDSKLNSNENYFWSDSRPEGFSFEVEVVSVGDKFTIYDINQESQGTLEVVQLQKEQTEEEQTVLKDGSIEKKVKIYALCKIEWYEKCGDTPLIPVTGVAIVRKGRRQASASVVKVVNVSLGGVKTNQLKGFELKPGIQSSSRRTTIIGEEVGDVPTKYTIVGLEPFELPIIGTYVDSRIISGFHYRVRLVGQKRRLFQGRSLLLTSVGMGYGKRLTFEPDCLNCPENYFWSDSHPDGVGLEPRAIHTGMKFEVMANGEHLGEASVFRADLPQSEERTCVTKLTGRSRFIVDKHIQVDVTCHMKLATTGGGLVDSEVHLMRVSGVALLRKRPEDSKARLIKVYNVGLDSQLNQLFVQSQTELVFNPLP